jgi:UDP-N-acetylmuramate dehydrogenase
MHWYSGLEAICQPEAPLAPHTWYGLGGPARWLLSPRSEEELATVLRRCTEHRVPWHVLGKGANVLVRDEGFAGAVIKLSEPAWEVTRFDDPRVHAAAGVDFPRLVRQTIARGLLGLEALAGIPGTVGGAVRMNAGGKHGYLAQFVTSASLMTPAGDVQVRSNSELGFGYRSTRLDGAIVLEATLVLTPGDVSAAMERFREIWNEKYATQPPVSAKSAGCIFKNPPGHAAGRLVDEAGLKGVRRGQAEISPRHANFIMAYPGARAADVLDLIALAQQRVRARTGIELEPEVDIW